MNQKARQILARNILLVELLDQVAGILSRAQIYTAALKGAGLLLTVYRQSFDRDMEDIDLLVNAQDLFRAESALSACGWRRVEGGEYGFYRDRDPAVIDMHTALWYMDGVRGLEYTGIATGRGTKKALDRSRLIAVNANSIYVLSYEDMWIQCALQSLIHRANIDARAIRDLRQIIAHAGKEFSWDYVFYVLESSVSKQTGYLGMSLLHKYGVFVPETIIDRLKPRPGVFMSGLWQRVLFAAKPVDDMGFLFRLFAMRGAWNKLSYIRYFLFPSEAFLCKRYGTMNRSKPSLLFTRLISLAKASLNLMRSLIYTLQMHKTSVPENPPQSP